MERLAEAVESEVCPNCGSLVEWLNDATGWCQNCSVDYCKCGSKLPPGKNLCASCRYDAFLERNADALERYTAQGLSLEAAKHRVLEDNRPYCLCCLQPIRHGENGTVYFCTQNPKCRKAKRRYRTLKGRYPSEVALQITIQEILALREAEDAKQNSCR